MVKRMQVVLEDDLDGSPATTTIRFALEGASYEIDVNDENATQLRQALAPWVAHATKVTAASAPSGRRSSSRRNNSSDVREWAAANGYKVSSRGRVPAEVKEAYDRAH